MQIEARVSDWFSKIHSQQNLESPLPPIGDGFISYPVNFSIVEDSYFATFPWPGMRICASNTPKPKLEDPQLSTATTTVVHYCCTFLCWCQSLLLLLWLLPSIVATTHTVTTPVTVIEVMSWDHTHHCCQSHTILLVMEPFLQQSTTKLISLSVMYIQQTQSSSIFHQ